MEGGRHISINFTTEVSGNLKEFTHLGFHCECWFWKIALTGEKLFKKCDMLYSLIVTIIGTISVSCIRQKTQLLGWSGWFLDGKDDTSLHGAAGVGKLPLPVLEPQEATLWFSVVITPYNSPCDPGLEKYQKVLTLRIWPHLSYCLTFFKIALYFQEFIICAAWNGTKYFSWCGFFLNLLTISLSPSCSLTSAIINLEKCWSFL